MSMPQEADTTAGLFKTSIPEFRIYFEITDSLLTWHFQKIGAVGARLLSPLMDYVLQELSGKEISRSSSFECPDV
jgi:hypothetical protein